jgi:general secretion pathway protein L
VNTLYLRLPSKAAAEAAEHWAALPCPFAVVNTAGNIEREGIEPLSQLEELAARVRQVVLLLSASDVSLLRMQVPPLPPNKLKAALPNLVEDQLIGDPADCVIVAGPAADGMRTIAIVQRAWLEILAKTFAAFGVQKMRALPAQLCLPLDPPAVAAAVTAQSTDMDVTLRLNEHEGIGLPIAPEHPENAMQEVIAAIGTLAPHAPITLYAPPQELDAYRDALEQATTAGKPVTIQADRWSNWISSAQQVPIDMMSGMGTDGDRKIDWKRWRFPLTLASLLLLVHIVGLNIQAAQLRSEAASLRTSLNEIYRSVYPNETVILDPLAQMQKKVEAARRGGADPAGDEFVALLAAFGESLETATKGQPNAPTPQGVEYRERTLFVRMPPNVNVPADQMGKALGRYNLTLQAAPSQADATVWQIRRRS